MAQSFNDTIYFNSGEERAVNVVKETNTAISYKYEKPSGILLSGRTRKLMLRGFAIYDESGVLLVRELKEKRPQQEVIQRESKGGGAGLFIVGFLTGVVTTIGGSLLLLITAF